LRVTLTPFIRQKSTIRLLKEMMFMMTESTPYLIAGLGNPGPRYHNNRHNVGFMVVDALADDARIPIRRFEFRALVGKGIVENEPAILAKPQTFMNDSGQAVAPLMHFYKIPNEKLLVVHDDLDLPFGTLRLRPQGGAGGQRGMGSIMSKLNTQDFARLRVGIGRPPGRMAPRDYVLHDFDSEEEQLLPEVLQNAVDAIRRFVADGIEKAMNDFNGRVIDEE
jgi:peptidyl-tRNA hydrolase, PTH1 family